MSCINFNKVGDRRLVILRMPVFALTDFRGVDVDFSDFGGVFQFFSDRPVGSDQRHHDRLVLVVEVVGDGLGAANVRFAAGPALVGVRSERAQVVSVDVEGFDALRPQVLDEGVFVSGDAADKTYRQAVTAAGYGLHCSRWMRSDTSRPKAFTDLYKTANKKPPDADASGGFFNAIYSRLFSQSEVRLKPTDTVIRTPVLRSLISSLFASQ